MPIPLDPSPVLVAPPAQGPTSTVVLKSPREGPAGVAADLLLRAAGGTLDESTGLARRLAALGTDVAPFLLEVLEKGGVPVGVDPARPYLLEIRPELREIVIEALSGLPRASVIALLRSSTQSTDLDKREAALGVLGKMGTKAELSLLASLSAPIDSDGLVSPRMRGAFQDSLTRVLARDVDAFSKIPELYTAVPPALVFPMIRAIQLEHSREALEALADLLGTRPEADLLVLLELSRAADDMGPPSPQSVCQKTRRFLTDGAPERLQAAATLAGALEDYDAIPDLTRLLSHSNEQVTRSARAALKKIARKDLGRRAEEWNHWYKTETEWWTTKSTATLQALRGSDPAQAAAAVLELGRRRLQRHDAALLLGEGLLRPEPDIVRTCCQALGLLRSPLALPALEAAEQHADPRVRDAAREAIALIGEPKGSRTTVRAAQPQR